MFISPYMLCMRLFHGPWNHLEGGIDLITASRPRSVTKGPLDPTDDPLAPQENITSPRQSQVQSPAGSDSPARASPAALDRLAAGDVATARKDLSFLLRPEIYHPLSQLEIPPPLRSDFPSPRPDQPLSSSLSALDRLLAEGHFLLAAHLSGSLLTSPEISPMDTNTIFTLLYTRLACLELTGNTLLAAQESKALEDLNSGFYYLESDLETAASEGDRRRYPRHIVPWPLRVLAVRLQSIGFGDSRRGIAGLYELGLEARRVIMRPGIDKTEKEIWKERLADLGIRSVNALIEMGDLDAARRQLDGLKGPKAENDTEKLRKALLYVRIGDVGAAKQILNESSQLGEGILKPLLNMAEGRYGDAVDEWRSLLEKNINKPNEAMIAQNLAVCLLYTGQLNESRALLESLVSADNCFQSLTFNLATIYELCSEKARNLKVQLAEEVARQYHSGEINVDRTNADFKL